MCAVLVGCSSTTDPEPADSASTVAQQQVDNFCQDVPDAITNKDSADPADQAERIAELQERAADALTECEKELQDAINAG